MRRPRRLIRPLLVGQAPGPNGLKDGVPLDGRNGDRLAALVGVVRVVAAFDVVNLLDEFPGKDGKGDAFPVGEARAAARMLERLDGHAHVVLLGGNVCRAFGLKLKPLAEMETRGRRWLHVPHPSRVNRWWNDPDNVANAERTLRRFTGL